MVRIIQNIKEKINVVEGGGIDKLITISGDEAAQK